MDFRARLFIVSMDSINTVAIHWEFLIKFSYDSYKISAFLRDLL